ncbi:MAG: radical SAM protein [bacterium]|nr:radical SAM protein [bacterium]
MKILLISTYELGRQPFGLASPAAMLKADGHDVTCADLAVGQWPTKAVAGAGLIAFYLPMHTATRLAIPVIENVRDANPGAHLCCYGLYAPLNEKLLTRLGVRTLIGGEFEQALVELASRLSRGEDNGEHRTLTPLDHVRFLPPDRTTLPPLDHYAALLVNGSRKPAGYTEASRGCKHKCRHCPVAPVYDGAFRVVPPEVVLADIRGLVSAGAEHITFGDPDFFNGPRHAQRIVEDLHAEFPELTYDVTIKVEHLKRHRELLGVLRETGCLFVTSAVESVDDEVLGKLNKGHTRRDFIEVVEDCRKTGLDLAPTFIPFTPWTSWEGCRELLGVIAELDMVQSVAPIQLALRLLVTWDSRLLELPEIRAQLDGFDESGLVYRWRHSDPSLDELAAKLLKLVAEAQRLGWPRHQTFSEIWRLVHGQPLPQSDLLAARSTIPYLEEPWYC